MKCEICNKEVSGKYSLCESCRNKNSMIQEKSTMVQEKVEDRELSSIDECINEIDNEVFDSININESVISSIYCKKCNYNVGDNLQFCPKCGSGKTLHIRKKRISNKKKIHIFSIIFIYTILTILIVFIIGYSISDRYINVQNKSLYPINVDGLWGYVDEYENYVIDTQFEEAHEFSEGLALVRVDGLYGYIDKKGNYVIHPQFEEAYEFSEGLALVRVDGLYGYINNIGHYEINPQFAEAEGFLNGRARVYIDGLYRYINKMDYIVP